MPLPRSRQIPGAGSPGLPITQLGIQDNSIVGPAGPEGPEGPEGPQGPQGPAGAGYYRQALSQTVVDVIASHGATVDIPGLLFTAPDLGDYSMELRGLPNTVANGADFYPLFRLISGTASWIYGEAWWFNPAGTAIRVAAPPSMTAILAGGAVPSPGFPCNMYLNGLLRVTVAPCTFCFRISTGSGSVSGDQVAFNGGRGIFEKMG